MSIWYSVRSLKRCLKPKTSNELVNGHSLDMASCWSMVTTAWTWRTVFFLQDIALVARDEWKWS